ncbi:phospholipase D family protein [Pseudorhodoferax sp. Leaf265]|jgi:putative cardiolipin synthase|uniref:phospholipase D family protein n=1 Tax=Pseudorhodoferax sp. Leaf265 TaxID=1736315 RepID=UPI000A57B4CA|nr:phospholipase D family protein [Pseudorhodoferax sp. Leaf265]
MKAVICTEGRTPSLFREAPPAGALAHIRALAGVGVELAVTGIGPVPAMRTLARWLLPLFALLVQACTSLAPRAPLPYEATLPDARDSPLGRLAQQVPAAGLSGFRLLPDGAFALDARLVLAQRAERTLDLQYYLFRCDAIGLAVLQALAQAAERGVRVRLLVDDLHVDDDDARFAAFAAHPNVQVRLFNPLPARGGGVLSRLVRSLPELRRINHRMHNKLFIADDSLSVSGGRNIGREYFMQDADANFIDMDILALGPVVREQSASFDRYWNSEHAYPIGALARTAPAAPLPAGPAALPDPGHAQDALGRARLSQELAAGPLDLIWAPGRVVADLPDKIARPESAQRFADSVTEHTLDLVRGAQRRVLIICPYFIPGKVGLDIMRDAQRRQVRTTLLTNALGATDEALVHFAYAGYRREVLRLGVEVYELGPDIARRLRKLGNFGRSQGRLHAKMAIVDETQMFIGSMNMDERSASVNTEVGLLIDSPALVRDFRRLMDGEHFRSAYRLRLGENDRLQWIDRDDDGREEVLDAEPGLHPWLRLKRWLLTPIVPEDLL